MENTGHPSLAATGLAPARPVQWSLARKVTLALISILAFTLLITAFFSYYKFESVYSAMVQSRYSFVVFTIKKRVEDSLNLGLPLRQLRQAQDILERETARDSQIVAIEIFDYRGDIVFDSDRGAIGSKVPAGLVDAAAELPSQAIGGIDDDNLMVALPLVNSLGKLEGGVVLRYRFSYVNKGITGLGWHLARIGALELAAFSLVATLCLYFLFVPVGRRLREMEARLRDALNASNRAPAVRDGAEFEERFDEFVARSREVIDHIGEATEEVGRLDRLQ